MTAGQSAGQLRRTDPSGIYVVIAAVVAGALAVAILATLMVEHPAAKAPAAAPIPVAPVQFRLEEHATAIPAAVPAPSIQFRLEEHGQALPLSPDDWARTHSVAPLSPDELERTLVVAGGAAAGSATVSQEARARAQMSAAGSATAIPAPNVSFLLEEHGQTVVVNTEAWARAQMAAASATAIPAPNSQFLLEEHGVAVHDSGIPYEGSGAAARIIRGASGSGTEAPVVSATSRGLGSSSTGIPYEGTGLAAQIIRDSSVVAVHDSGIPYEGSGAAARIIRGASGSGTEAPVVSATSRGLGSSSTGIPYEGTGLAAQIIRDSSVVAVPSNSTSHHPHGKLVSPATPAAETTNGYSRWGMNAQ